MPNVAQTFTTRNIALYQENSAEIHRLTPPPPPVAVLHLIAVGGSLMAVAWSLLVLGSHGVHAVEGVELVPRFLTISTMSAMGFLLGGASLLLFTYGSPAHLRRTAAQIGGGFISVWGLGCLAVDQWIIPAQHMTAPGPIVCVILVSLGLGVLTLPLRTSTGHRLFQYFAGAIVLMGGVAITGYLYHVPPLSDSSAYGPIDAPTAVLSIVLGLALLCIYPTEGLMRTLLSPDIGGALLRRLLPFAIGLPILGGWLRILGQRQGWYGFDFGVAVAIGVVLAILLACLWYVADWADRVDRERHSMSQACKDQETRLNLAAAAARIGYWRWLEGEDVIEIDQVSAELLGLSSVSTITLSSLEQAIRMDDRGPFHQAMETARQESTPFEIECQPVSTTQDKWISLRGFPLARTQTSPYRFHGVVLDITERRTVQETLRESQQRLNSIVQSAMDAIITVDQDQHVILFNKAAEQLFRCRAEDALGRPIDQFIPERFRQRHDSHMAKFRQSAVMARQMGRPGSVRALRADGQEFPIEASISQVNVGGHNLCTVILRDITEPLQSKAAIREREARMAEQTLKRWADELENRVSERTTALSRSQERLRALTAQLTRTEHQERRRIAGELHDYLAQLLVAAHLKLAQDRRPVVTAGDRTLVKDLERILDEALTYTRSLVAKLSPPVLYHLGLPAALQWLAEQMEEHQLVVETAFDIPSTLPKLPDDVAAILFQSVRELLFNVVKHAASSHVQIVLRTILDQTLVIVVTDQGQGFDTSQLDQASTASSSFGLFSIKERMEALGGSVHVNSQVGQGTSVTLLCPLTILKKAASSPSSDPQDRVFTARHTQLADSIRVLLVDDHAMVRQGIRALLERHPDVEVVGEAWDGQHACGLVDALHPDVVVMDANMPRLDGIEATRRIKELHPQVVIIGLSVQTAAQVASSMLQAGASRYLTKESAGEQLYETIITAVADRG